MSAAALPPWGQMDAGMLKQIGDRPIPEAFRPQDGGTLEQEWRDWFDTLADELSTLLWPKFDPHSGTWVRPPDQALIDADFTLMASLCKQLDEPVQGLASVKTPHRVFYEEEDDERVLIGAGYERYDPAFPEYLRKDRQLTYLLLHGCNRKLGSLHVQLKQIFQRPRPYQVALLQRQQFQHVRTRLGYHPSFISGHCVQGSVAGLSVYLQVSNAVDFASIDILKQFTVDIGDRRVFAGVHYPSDNLSSWYTAFKLLRYVIDKPALPAARAFLWDAIRSKSRVYQAIDAHARQHGAASPYTKVIAAIAAVAEPRAEEQHSLQ